MTVRNFKGSPQPTIYRTGYYDIFKSFMWDTWFFHYWAPHRRHDWPPHRRQIGICLLGRCWFMDVWIEETE